MDIGQISGALVVAFVTGLAYLAAAFPKTFAAVAEMLLLVVIATSVAAFSFDLGVMYGASSVMPSVDMARAAAAREATQTLRLPMWVPLAWTALAFYLQILGYISRRLTAEKKEKEGRGDKAE